MALANTRQFANELDPEYNKIFFDEYTEREPEYTMSAKVLDAPPGNRYSEGVLSGLGGLVSMGEGDLITYDTPVEGKTLTIYYEKFGLGFQLTEEMYKDDLHGHLRSMPRKLAKSARYTTEVQAARIFNNGFTTETANDGLSVFNDSHTLLYASGTTYDNDGDATSLSETSLDAAIQYFEDLVDEQGFPIQMDARLLMVPSALRGTAKVLLGTPKIVNSANNDISKVYDEGLGWMVNHYFTSTTAWFVMGVNADNRLYWKDRFRFLTAEDPPTGNALFMTKGRFVPKVFDPRGMYGASG